MIPPHGRLAGIDYGSVRIGVSVSDPNRMVASPLDTYTRRDVKADAAYFQQLVEEEQIVGFVIGLPVHMSGEESAKSHETRRFGTWLAEVTDRPIGYCDERYTTVQAEQMLDRAGLRGKKRKARLDRIAAQIILATYLESDGSVNGHPGPLDDKPT
ncbi:MAG: Holliday junction resolvase RuvX [Pirellulaceae bacterium]